MTSQNPDDGRSHRREFLAALSAASAASLAGCAGLFGGGSDGGATPEPTPVETTRPPSTATPTATMTDTPTVTPTETPTPTPTVTPTPTQSGIDFDPDIIDTDIVEPRLPANITYTTPIGIDVPVGTGGSDGGSGDTATPQPPDDPSSTSESNGGIDVTVAPASADQQPTVGTEKLGERQRTEKDDMVCTTQRQRSTAGGSDGVVGNLVLNHRLNELWPGAIIPARSVANGGYGPALQGRLSDRSATDVRNPITLALYIDANRYKNRNPDTSKEIDSPTSDRAEQARIELLQDVQQGTSAAQLAFDIKQIHSEKHLDINMGVNYNGLSTSISSDFSYSRDSVTNKLLVKLLQVYYYMGVTFPNSEGRFVTDPSVVDKNDLLISDVAFGRLLLFSAESKHTAEDMKLALEASFSGIGGSGSAEVNVERERVLNETRIKGQAIGGNATNAAQLISDFGQEGISRIRQYAVEGANYGPDTPGAPIGFTARYLSNGDRSNTYLTTEYNARSCYPKTRKFRIHNVKLTVKNAGGDGGGNLKLYGDITIRPSHPDGPVVIAETGNAWSRDRDQFVKIDENRSQTLAGLDHTVEFEVGEGRTWSEYMKDASISITASLRERDNLSDDEYQGEDKNVSWNLTDPVSQTPTIVFSEENNVVHMTFDVSPVPLQNQ